MSLRITQSMIFARSLQDVRNASRDIIRLQEQVASGRRINRPSDDPAAMLRLLPLNSELRNLDNLKDNTQTARETLNIGATSLEEGSSIMSRLRELLVAAANSTVSQDDRKTMGLEIDELLEHMVGVANAQRGNSYLFSGTRTETPPFKIVDGNGGTRVSYQGSKDEHEISVGQGIKTKLFSAGDRFFQTIDRQQTTISGTTGAAATSAKDTGRGFADLRVTFGGLLSSSLPSGITAGSSVANSTAVGSLSYVYDSGAGTLSIGGGTAVAVPATNATFTTAAGETIHLDVATPVSPASGNFTARANLSTDNGTSTTLVDFTSATAIVTNSNDGSQLGVNVSALVRTGTDEVTYTGAFDVFTVLIEARDALLNTRGDTPTAVQEKLRVLIGEVRTAHDSVLTGVQELGIRSGNLDLLSNRLDGLILGNESTRSNIADSDLTESISDMTRTQFGFQASLQVSARIAQLSLLDFLR